MKHPLDFSFMAKIFAADYIGHLLRYLIVAGGAFIVFYLWRNRRLRALKIQQKYPAASDIRREVLYSLVSLAIFAGVGVLSFVMFRLGWSRLYLDPKSHTWGYTVFSLVALILAHDTWFYWTHRLMHWKPIFPYVHLVHHKSHTPTPWASFAFHPLEAVVEAAIFPVVTLFLPVHPLVALLWLLYMTGMNVLGHCGFEILPRGFTRHALFRWHNTTTHHDMHHRFVHCNYGLYYNIWDRLMGTNHSRYEDEFDAVKARAAAARQEGRQGFTSPEPVHSEGMARVE